MPSDWNVHRNDDGIPFYHNSKTGATVWELPEGVTDPEDDSSDEDVRKLPSVMPMLESSKSTGFENERINPMSRNAAVPIPRLQKSASQAERLKLRRIRSRGSTPSNVDKMVSESVPIKDILIASYRITRHELFTEFLVYTFFIGLFLFQVFLIRDTHKAWEQQSTLRDSLLDEEFPDATYKKNFYEIMTKEEAWEWLLGPMTSALFVEEWYNGRKLNENETNYVYGVMEIVGKVQIRQHRVESRPCAKDRLVLDDSHSCFAAYVSGSESLGLANLFTESYIPEADTCFCPRHLPSKSHCLSIGKKMCRDNVPGQQPQKRTKCNAAFEKALQGKLSENEKISFDKDCGKLLDRWGCVDTCDDCPNSPEQCRLDNLVIDGEDEKPKENNETRSSPSSSQADTAPTPVARRLTGSGKACKGCSFARESEKGAYCPASRCHCGSNHEYCSGYVFQDFESTVHELKGYGPLGGYGKRGVEYLIDLDPERARIVMDKMKDKLWIDQATRAVVINFNVYNTMTRFLTVCRIIIEFTESGMVYPSSEFITMATVPLTTQTVLGLASISTVLSFNAFYLGWVFYELRVFFVFGNCKSYCTRRSSSLIEVVVLVYLGVYITLFWTWVMWLESRNVDIEPRGSNNDYTDLWGLGIHFKSCLDFGGFFGIVASFKMIKYISISKHARLLIDTLISARGTLFYFILFLGVLLLGFVFCSTVWFGADDAHFHDTPTAIMTLFRYLLGDFDYVKLHETRREGFLVDLFFVGYQVLFYFLSLNILIAIVISEFEIVKLQSDNASRWKKEVPSLLSDFFMKGSVRTFRCLARCRPNSTNILLMSSNYEKAEELYDEDPETYGKAYEATRQYWKMKFEVMYLDAVSQAIKVGRSQKSRSVDLHMWLEHLYSKWDKRAKEAVKLGLTDGKLPISYIGPDRLCLLINEVPCRCEKARSMCSGLCTHPRQHCVKACAHNVICHHQRVTQGGRGETTERCAAKGLVAAYHALTRPIVTAPILSNASKWTHDEVMKGEKLCFDFDSDTLRDSVFSVKKKNSRGRWQWRTLFIDIGLCKIFTLTPLSQDAMLEKRRCCGLLQASRQHVRRNVDGGGRLLKSLDLMNLQQIHKNKRDDSVCELLFSDIEKTHYCLSFASSMRREQFVNSCRVSIDEMADAQADGEFMIREDEDGNERQTIDTDGAQLDSTGDKGKALEKFQQAFQGSKRALTNAKRRLSSVHSLDPGGQRRASRAPLSLADLGF